MYVHLEAQSPSRRYFIMTQLIIPRPIAWVLSDNGDGGYNLAPFSYFNGVSSDPPLIFLSIGAKRDGSLKDTRVNIEQRRYFVVHIAHRELAAPLTETSRSLPHGESELDRIEARLTPFEDFPLPRMEACRVALACELYGIHPIGETGQAMVLGKVSSVFVADDAVEADVKGRLKIRAERIDPLGRLGASEYVTFGEILSIPRPA